MWGDKGKMWPHLIIECRGCRNKEILTDGDAIKQLVRDIAEIADIHIETSRTKQFKTDKDRKKWGVSNTTIISESHIAVHTWPEKRRYTDIEIYSCKLFDKQEVVRYIQRTLRPIHMNVIEVERGTLLDSPDRKRFPRIRMQRITALDDRKVNTRKLRGGIYRGHAT